MTHRYPNNLLAAGARVLALVAALAVVGVAHPRADFDAGRRAYAIGDYDTAFKEWLSLAEAGHPVAQNNIGYMYRKGFGVRLDEAAAAEWYRRAAEQGILDAMTNLGYMYDEGRGVERDHVQSYKWFVLAVENGYEDAAGHLKILEESYMTPEQVAEAKRLAAEWRPKAPASGE
jgi:TPR repeat protein